MKRIVIKASEDPILDQFKDNMSQIKDDFNYACDGIDQLYNSGSTGAAQEAISALAMSIKDIIEDIATVIAKSDESVESATEIDAATNSEVANWSDDKFLEARENLINSDNEGLLDKFYTKMDELKVGYEEKQDIRRFIISGKLEALDLHASEYDFVDVYEATI